MCWLVLLSASAAGRGADSAGLAARRRRQLVTAGGVPSAPPGRHSRPGRRQKGQRAPCRRLHQEDSLCPRTWHHQAVPSTSTTGTSAISVTSTNWAANWGANWAANDSGASAGGDPSPGDLASVRGGPSLVCGRPVPGHAAGLQPAAGEDVTEGVDPAADRGPDEQPGSEWVGLAPGGGAPAASTRGGWRPAGTGRAALRPRHGHG